MRCASTAVLPEKVEDQDSGKFSLNHSTVELVPPTIDSTQHSAMILLMAHYRSAEALRHPKNCPADYGLPIRHHGQGRTLLTGTRKPSGSSVVGQTTVLLEARKRLMSALSGRTEFV
jgi:hypothetical protein